MKINPEVTQVKNATATYEETDGKSAHVNVNGWPNGAGMTIEQFDGIETWQMNTTWEGWQAIKKTVNAFVRAP